jgi:hypothetical protein
MTCEYSGIIKRILLYEWDLLIAKFLFQIQYILLKINFSILQYQILFYDFLINTNTNQH